MSIFRTSNETVDGYQLLLRDLEQTTDDLKDAYNNLENVVEPDLIDYTDEKSTHNQGIRKEKDCKN